MASTEGGGAARFAWDNPVLRFEGFSRAPADVVYDLLADLQSHLEWSGRRQLETTRLLTMTAPPGPAGVGTEFFTTGSDGKVARWADRSVVTEAIRPRMFEFVTEGRRQAKPGSRPWLMTLVHRYEIAPEGGGSRVTYTEDLTRWAGAPWVLRMRAISRILFRMSAKYMQRGFDGLLALAEESSVRSAEFVNGRREP
ncbi:MAG: hypothetical protein E6I95_10765 [Chloroflexi bacterium]|nr:MAG: hypothetical protein E6I95_10765 [Chloroflexota bacterium]